MPRRTVADELPEPVAAVLSRVRRRIRWNEFCGGMLRTIGVGFAALLVLALIDVLFVSMPIAVRLGAWGLGLAIVAAVFMVSVLRPLFQRRTILDFAQEIEKERPEFQERLSTLVSLSGGGQSAVGEKELVKALGKMAKRDVKRIKARKDFPMRPALGALAAIVFGGVLVGLGFWLSPGKTQRVLMRAGNPLSAQGNVFSDGLSVAPGDFVIGEGQPLTISVRANRGADDFAEILRWEKKADPSIEKMAVADASDSSAEDDFTIRFPAVSRSFSYRIRKGRMVSAMHRVEVIPRPSVETMSVRYLFPSYTELPEKKVEGGALSISAVEGTRAEMAFSVSRPVKDATLYVNETPLWAHSRTGDPQKPVLTWKVDLKPHYTGIWRLELRDESGVTNEPWEGIMEVVADAAPRVAVLSPSVQELEVHPDELLPVSFEAADDFGLKSASIFLNGENGTVKEVSAGSLGGESNLELSLKELAEAEEEVVELIVRVTDGRSEKWGGPQVTESEPVVLLLSRSAESVPVQTLASQRKRFANRLWSAIEVLMEAERLALPLPSRFVANAPREGTPLQAIGSHCAMAEESVNEAASAMRESAFSRQSMALEAIAYEDISASRRAISEALLEERSRGKAHESRKALRSIETAISRLQQVLRDFDDSAIEATMAAKLESLSTQQAELAELISDPNNIAMLPELQEAQGILATQLGELLARGAESKARQLLETIESGKDLVSALATLEVRQRELGEMMLRLDEGEKGEGAFDELLSMIAVEQQELGIFASWLGWKQGENLQKLGFVAMNGDSVMGYLLSGGAEDASRSATANEVIIKELIEDAIDEDREDLSYLLSRQERLRGQISAVADEEFDAAVLVFQERLLEQARELESLSEALLPVVMQFVAVTARRDIDEAREALKSGIHSAINASQYLEGTAESRFAFVANPGNLPHHQSRPPGAPPAPVRFGDGAPANSIPGDSEKLANATVDFPDGAEPIIRRFPPVIGDMEIVILQDLPAEKSQKEETFSRAEFVQVRGITDGIGVAGRMAIKAADDWASAKAYFRRAAESLSKIELDETGLYLSEDVRDAFEAVMEAELPSEAAIAASLATEGLQEMASTLGTEESAGTGWADLADEIAEDQP
ncbi:MAG: hypothetical protein AAGA58_12175, partial [Verrucomicrobiota bacterium]